MRPDLNSGHILTARMFRELLEDEAKIPDEGQDAVLLHLANARDIENLLLGLATGTFAVVNVETIKAQTEALRSVSQMLQKRRPGGETQGS